MTAKYEIYTALLHMLGTSRVTACKVYRGWGYDGVVERYGWYFCEFGETPTFIGENKIVALATIEDITVYNDEVVCEQENN